MNAKKIMGAVLVALLAAALFIGAGAAALQDGTVFTNQKLAEVDYGVNWIGTNGVFKPLADPLDPNFVYFPAGSEGVYTYETTVSSEKVKYTITVAAPKVTISAVAGTGIYAYSFIDGTYYTGTDVTVAITYPAGLSVPAIYMTTPDVSDLKVQGADLATIQTNIANAIKNPNAPLGDYSLVAVFKDTDFVNGTLYDNLITKPVSFKVAEAGSVTIASSVDQALKSEGIKVTITGQPGMYYHVSYDANAFTGNGNQMGLPGVESFGAEGFTFQMPNTGSVNFVVNGGTGAGDSEKMTVVKSNDQGVKENGAKSASITIKFLKGTITAEADAESYFIGDEVTITGINKAGTIKAMTLKGTNFYNESIFDVVKWEKTGENFEFTFDTSDIINDKPGFSGKKLDVGAYTLTIIVGNVEEPDAKATVVVSLKQPFISIVEAPEVIVQDTKAEFIVNAEATTKIRYYIFGTNYFNASADVTDLVEDTTNQFTFTLNEAFTEAMDAGQYFMVIQHPMYNGEFDIEADGTTIELDGTPLFNVDLRQTANAAQALCDALDTQNIDDMYVKYSFFVVGEDESFTISEIPSTIAQGETFTISGVSTANAGEFVTVEMISTAFAAVPKETVGSAAFIAVTTQIAEDGTWEVTFDTSDLNVDEYSLKVACTGQEKPWKNVNVNVVAAADKPDTPDTPDVPDTPDTPDTPTEPETPGFGALAALAGLGAVAVLLLRRE